MPVEGVAEQDHDQATNGKQLGHALTDRATPVDDDAAAPVPAPLLLLSLPLFVTPF